MYERSVSFINTDYHEPLSLRSVGHRDCTICFRCFRIAKVVRQYVIPVTYVLTWTYQKRSRFLLVRMPTEPHIYAYVSRVLVRPSLQNVPRSIVSGQSRKVKVCQNRHYLVPDRDCSTSAEKMFYAPSKMPRLEVSPARFEFEKTCFYLNVLDYLGTVGKYRTVSKAFVPHEYITSVVFAVLMSF